MSLTKRFLISVAVTAVTYPALYLLIGPWRACIIAALLGVLARLYLDSRHDTRRQDK